MLFMLQNFPYEELKEAVKKLEKNNVNQALNHRQVNRPWGVFDSIERGERFQVKKITLNVEVDCLCKGIKKEQNIGWWLKEKL